MTANDDIRLPWSVVESDGLWSIHDAHGAVVFFGMEENIARLFAAAPDMLASMQGAYDILCAGKPPHSARESNARRVLRTAIAKAEGRS